MEYEHIVHSFELVYDKDSEILIYRSDGASVHKPRQCCMVVGAAV